MKFLLTSTGFSNHKIAEKFLSWLKNPAGLKVAIIPTAASEKENNKFVQLDINNFKNWGCGQIDIIDLEFLQPADIGRLDDYQVIYVAGGNTFYLLKYVKQSGFADYIQANKDSDKIYIGVSAGSIISGLNIATASIGGEIADKNEVGLQDLTGLGIVNGLISPHYTAQEAEEVESLRQQTKLKIITLTDAQALVIENRQEIIIS